MTQVWLDPLWVGVLVNRSCMSQKHGENQSGACIVLLDDLCHSGLPISASSGPQGGTASGTASGPAPGALAHPPCSRGGVGAGRAHEP